MKAPKRVDVSKVGRGGVPDPLLKVEGEAMKGIEVHEGGGATFTGEGITFLRETMMLRCLKMEMRGIKMVRHSVYAQVKREFGFKGNKQKVYDQLLAYVQQKVQDAGAAPEQVDAALKVGAP